MGKEHLFRKHEEWSTYIKGWAWVSMPVIPTLWVETSRSPELEKSGEGQCPVVLLFWPLQVLPLLGCGHTRTHVHARTHACTHTYTYTHTQTHAHNARPHTHMHTHVHTCTQMHTCTYIHTCTHMYTHVHMRTHTHTPEVEMRSRTLTQTTSTPTHRFENLGKGDLRSTGNFHKGEVHTL